MKKMFLPVVVVVVFGLAAAFGQDADLLQKASAGDAAAQVKIGNQYALGQGVARNSREAVKWYRKAAEQGYPDGQYRLGGLYDVGFGVPPDPATAVKWYQQAAKQGLPDAEYRVGFMYDQGRGVSKDDTQAAKWYQLAASAGRPQPDNPTKLHGEDIAHIVKAMLEMDDRGFTPELSIFATNPQD